MNKTKTINRLDLILDMLDSIQLDMIGYQNNKYINDSIDNLISAYDDICKAIYNIKMS